MNVLIDTLVWVDYFKHNNNAITWLCLNDCSVIHPMIIGELACGTPPAPRSQTLSDLSWLRPSKQASHDEVITFIERETLYGLGCGLIDLTLLASTLITDNYGRHPLVIAQQAARNEYRDKRTAELIKQGVGPLTAKKK